ncbi:tyrosine-protein kinase receptor Tie-1-like [Anneissia japonica]|uniref:tyrosine-protein kinase receptor Tie-1-like n=1 Tax=Anneissia japonica TaxID=1529436 RepID=UPI00142562A9|nr:tyrosine-protein kinase receptor Tie-1-like [Anneissia japonica]
MVGFTSTPAVKEQKETIIRGYSLGSDKSENITLSFNLLCNNSDVHKCVQHKRRPKFREAKISSKSDECTVDARIGVFTAYAEKGERNGTATIIVHHADSYVEPIVRTKTVSTGDSNVTLGVKNVNGNNNILRWAKDGIDCDWNGLTEIKFDTITEAHAGIYECFQDDKREERKHAFMQLIVRECPHNKWSPPKCNMSCEVCYNGGVCDTYIGTCICPSGFIGTNCTIPTGGNMFGRDGGTPCRTGNSEGCKGKLICPPMPQGCACHAGWEGLKCESKCELGKYGADCLQDCHCDNDKCDHSRGCKLNATCHPDYNGTRCLVPNPNGLSSDRTTRLETSHGNVYW